MRSRLVVTIVPLFAAVSALAATSTALAADIASVIGPVGPGQWVAECPGPQSPPSGTSQLPACAGPNPDCLHRVVLNGGEFPDATCSDGTPGVFYVRIGSGDDVNRWVIHVQGGGGCNDYGSCLERWCGTQGALPYKANKMSSDWNADGVTDLAEHVRGPGMASESANNQFSTWSHAWAYYCSSDMWEGQESDVEMHSGTSSFAVDANGHHILHAMRKMLRKLNSNPAWTTAGDLWVPDLDDATEIVFTGTSAGAKGAISNADWFLSVFPDSDNSLVLDANFDISDDVLTSEDVWIDYDLDGVGDETYVVGREVIYNDEWLPGGYAAEIDAFVDESCRAFYEPLGRMDRCNQFSTMLTGTIAGAPIISTPTFSRFDLIDNLIRDQYTQHPNDRGYSLLIGGMNGTPIDPNDYAVLSRATLLETWLVGAPLTGVFAPRCGDHVGLENDAVFAAVTTPDTDDVNMASLMNPSNFHDALLLWLNVGVGVRLDTRYLDTSAPGAGFSAC
jgi:hypothetical protein